MVGTISTSCHTNEPSLTLPPASRYAAIKDTIARWAAGEAGPKRGSVEAFAESVVEDVVGKGKAGQIWKGPNASVVRLVSQWLPTWIVVRVSSFI